MAGYFSALSTIGAMEIGVVAAGATIIAALIVVAMQPLVKRRLTRIPKPWKKTGVLGKIKRVPSSLSAELAFPLLQAENAICEDAEFNTNDTNYPGTPGLYQVCRRAAVAVPPRPRASTHRRRRGRSSERRARRQ